MEIITSFQLYWILRLDAIWGLCLATAIASGIIASVTGLYYLIEWMPSDSEDEAVIFFKKFWKRTVTVFGIAVFLSVFLPDTKEACAIYAVPKVINNPKIHELCGNSLDVFGMGVKRIKERMMNAETDNSQEKQ